MLKKLSAQNENIALSFIAIFFISGINSVKAEIISGRSYLAVFNSHYQMVNENSQFRNGSSFPYISGNNISVGLPGVKKKIQTVNIAGKDEFSNISSIGPTQPEMTSFKSVGSDNMVSPFTGDFSYNIPLLDVGGYPINMFYNSGITMDEDASWVGLGWNINPGTIARNMRGLPDDFDGSDIIKKEQSFKDDKTWGVSTGGDVRIAGIPCMGFGIGFTAGASYNNKLGIATESGVHASISLGAKAGDTKTANLSLSAAMNASSRSGSSITPSVGISIQNQGNTSGGVNGSVGAGYTYSSRMGLSSMHLNANVSVNDCYAASFNSSLSFGYPSILPSVAKRFTKKSFSINTSVGLEYWWVNPTFKLGGYYTTTYLAGKDKQTTHPAYGMLHYQDAQTDDNALLDFNRANDGIYTPASPAIGMPVYTFDVFNISGEGTGGSFRAYRGDIGHMHDPTVVTREDQGSFGLDLGFGNIFHAGAEMSYVFSPSTVGDLTSNNATGNALSFDENHGITQSVYFKNPSEKTVPDANFQEHIGNEELVRFKLGDKENAKPMVLPKLIHYDALKNPLGELREISGNTRKADRDKRAQVISFLTAEESEMVGLNKKIYSYKANNEFENRVIYSVDCNNSGIDSFYRNHDGDHDLLTPFLGNETKKFRKKNHISEIDVLGGDGKKYIYGLPVYNKKQIDLSFSINSTDNKGHSMVTYGNEDNTIDNTKGRDGILEKQEMPPYTHSFLLTELLSANYVDVTGNGVTEDDMGDAVKFNYSKYDDYNWRTPAGSMTATYSEGLKTELKDDRAHYIYGERESWYLYSIESKNMVARFYVKNNRSDGKSVTASDNGDRGDFGSGGMQRLDKICLFSKADLQNTSILAKPIKTIRFFQSYKLCVNKALAGHIGGNTNPNSGKLTLDSIWITYNGNDAKPKNRYAFYYPADNNPDYDFESNDRWGNFKPELDNPIVDGEHISNADFPYAVQDENKANKNAAAWTMNKILLPSGAVIKIDYESDSYAYVQNKRACSMMQILGFGNSETLLPQQAELNKLYSDDGENEIVYVSLPEPMPFTGITPEEKRRAFASHYLADFKRLYLKLAVIMPTGSGLSGTSGFENISVYGDLVTDACGLISANVGWIKLAPLRNHTPMVQSVLQFLVQQLPGKAFKGYDVIDSDDGQAVVSALSGMIGSVKELFNGQFDLLMAEKKCRDVVLGRSFARLSNPIGTKFGGGLRVQKILIDDNWQKMTGHLSATYGQEYHYTTSELVNGNNETISSGVASWEPSIGGEENPHRDIMRYLDHNKGGPYDYGAIELPLGEMYYPAAMVGYSRVEVVSIHKDTVKNLPVRQVTEFYTNKDFPYSSTATELTGDAHLKHDPPKIMQLLKIDLKKFVTLSQGFLVETNDMNGKEKSKAVYTASDPTSPISLTKNFYNTQQVAPDRYIFNHTFPTLGNPTGKINNTLIGREIELMTDFREHSTETITANVNINFDLAMWGPLPIPIVMVMCPVTKESTLYRSAAVLKVITHYGMLDSVVVIDKGSSVSTKNLVYDAETGNPLLTRTQNEHNRPVYNFTYPAHWAYSGMGPAYKNIDASFTNLEFVHGILANPPQSLLDILESGDELYVTNQNSKDLDVSLPCDVDAETNTSWTTLHATPRYKIWAVNTSKSGVTTPQWVFMDDKGNPFNSALPTNGEGASVRIIRSGKRNMLDKFVGSVTTLEYPVVNGRLVFNENTHVIQSTAATFKDDWRVDNAFDKVVETVNNDQTARVHRIDLNPEDWLTVKWDHEWRGNQSQDEWRPPIKEVSKTEALSLFKQAHWWSSHDKSHFYDNRKNSFLLYSYNDVPANSITYKSMLNLYSHTNFIFPASQKEANHPGMHDGSRSQNDNKLLGEINALTKEWFNAAPLNPDPWINTYFINSLNNVSVGRDIIPYANTGWESYIESNNNRVNVSLSFKTNNGLLADQKKIGLRLRLANDENSPEQYHSMITKYRCFWSPGATGCPPPPPPPPPGTTRGCPYFAVPKLSHYYYQWGDMSTQNDFTDDPSVNTIVTRHISTTTGIFCRSRFTESKAMNPYVEGVLGNWRIDSTYAYYGERTETDPTPKVDLRIGGTIKNYKDFWKLAPLATNLPITRNYTADDVWKWNSAVTQYNRKGYEIENTDPLGRFNSGLYGYNQQLPIAAANNARVREIMFDGFEDYSYHTDGNCITCKPRRHINYNSDFVSKITPSQKHTGKFSLKLNPGQSLQFSAPVISEEDADKEYGIVIKGHTNNYTNTSLGSDPTRDGTGLKASYYNYAVNTHLDVVLDPDASSPVSTLITEVNPMPEIKVTGNEGESPATGVNPEYFSVKWEGRIQAPATGNYKFNVMSDNGYKLIINNQVLSSDEAWHSDHQANAQGWGNGNETTSSIALVVGETYPIQIYFYNQFGPYIFSIKWKTPLNNFAYTKIPTKYLYPPQTNVFQTVSTADLVCNRLDSVQVTGNGLTDTFSLIKNQKMLLSAWVKVGTANCCFPATYGDNVSNNITLAFTGSSTTYNFQPAGNVIEGWQRYECPFPLPPDAEDITVTLNNIGNNSPVFFDDLRLHPFNANVKSFVYHPSNLRLMAELDENNYASFYEYDDDGTLTRTKKETVRGIQTITETRSATQKIIVNGD